MRLNFFTIGVRKNKTDKQTYPFPFKTLIIDDLSSTFMLEKLLDKIDDMDMIYF